MTLKVLSTLAVKGALPALAERFAQTTGIGVVCDWSATKNLMARIGAGETGDVAILTREGIDELAARGTISPETIADLALSYVGVAVKAGAHKPDIGSADAVKAALLAADSLVYSAVGASGLYFARLIERLGIAEAVKAKARVVPSGFTAELVARGEVALAVQQVSELMVVPGIEVVGRLPDELQPTTTFSAGVFAATAEVDAATRLVRFLASAEAARELRAAGLEPAS